MSDSWDDNEELCIEFCSESRDMLAEIEPLLVELESSAESLGAVDSAEIAKVFRAFHSMKGSAGFLGLETIVAVTHAAESLLDVFREDPSLLCPEHVTALCRTMDFVNRLLEQVSTGFHDGGHEAEGRAIVELLKGLTGSTPANGPSGASAEDASRQAKATPDDETEGGRAGSDRPESPPPTDEIATPAAPARGDGDGGKANTPDADVSASAADPVAESGGTSDRDGRPRGAGAARGSTPEGGDGQGSPSAREDKAAKATLRVDLERLDMLMDLVGELILAETMVTHSPDVEGLSLPRFEKAAIHLNRITRSLQDVAMSTRMIPIGGTFRKMLRVVRDLARKQDKEIELEIVGADTEIDKTVVEAIGDPLVHIVRNSVDHGIEPRDVRVGAGKPAAGRVRLEARHQGGEIWIAVDDDGRGLDREVILEKAIARGLIASSEASELRDGEIFRWLFEPGFSTASEVTDVSGRGVGMDVVRQNIERLGGRVEITSELGQGTSIAIRLPLTLAIIEGMLVRVGRLTYTLPLLSIRESIPIQPGDLTRLTDGSEMVRIRGDLIPMVRLADYHGVPDASDRLEDGIAIVVQDVERFCLFVDEVIGQRQTVIKSLPEFLGPVPGVSGCSILSDGDVSLILDVSAIEHDRSARTHRAASDR